MKFKIAIEYGGGWRHFPVELFDVSEQFEHYRVSGRDRALVFRSNRPMLEKKGLKNKPADWKLVEGEMSNMSARAAVIHAIERWRQNNILVKFTTEGIEYSGALSQVSGAGDSETYHLEIDSHYCGRLRKAQGKWVFDSQTKATDQFIQLAEYFGKCVEG